MAANEPVYPDPMRGTAQSIFNHAPDELPTGLTKREYFAAMAMQGLCANSIAGRHNMPNVLAREAVDYADTLLSELEKPTT